MQMLAVPVEVPEISTSKYWPLPTEIDPVPAGWVLPRTLDSTVTLVPPAEEEPVMVVTIPVPATVAPPPERVPKPIEELEALWKLETMVVPELTAFDKSPP